MRMHLHLKYLRLKQYITNLVLVVIKHRIRYETKQTVCVGKRLFLTKVKITRLGLLLSTPNLELGLLWTTRHP